MMKMNQRMRHRLGQSTPSDFVRNEELSRALSQFLARGFTELDGAIIFTAARDIAEKIDQKNFPDLTGFESFVNHVHIEDQLDRCDSDEGAILKQGVKFGLETVVHLRSLLDGKPFTVIVAAPIHGCGVRFHLNRSGEEWLVSDLESYVEEAVLVLES